MVFKDIIHMEAAKLYSKLSKCKRKQVACVAVRDNRIIATGINGTLPGQPNKCEDWQGNTIDTVVHSELNLVSFCAKEGISLKGCTLYVTLSPCIHCAKMIVAAGIKKVVYEELYRDTEGKEFLEKLIDIRRIDSDNI